MSKIINIIPQQAYELIRDRIANILVDELTNQALLDPSLKVSIYIERSTAFSEGELPAINISLARGVFNSKSAPTSDGGFTFFIDHHTSAPTDAINDGDSLSAIRLQRFIGLSKAILENPVYRTLGFEMPFVSSVAFTEFNIAEPGAMKQDAANTAMGRLVFLVKATDKSELIVPKIMAGYNTKINIGTSGKGYSYIGGTVI